MLAQIALPLALVAAVVVWSTFQAVEGLVEHRLQKEIELVARAIRMPVQQAYADDDLDRVAQSLNAVFAIGRVYGAYVYDADGRRVVVAGESRPGMREQLQAAELVELGQELGEYVRLAGEPVFSYFVPLTGPTGRIIGLLQVVRQESDIAQQLAEVRTRAWWVWGIVVVAMIAVVLVGHRRVVSRHVERLLGSMSRVESGQREHRATVAGPHELATLGRGLNRMLDGIARMENELAQRRRQHQAMSERLREQEKLAALGHFSSGVAHELGAPLSVIDGDARRLQRAGSLEPESQRRLGRIREQIQRTRRLISQLMEFVRTDRREPTCVPLARLVDVVISGVAPEREARGIELQIDMQDAELSVIGYEIRLEHAVLNLLRNALQAARRRVQIGGGVDIDGRVWLAVEDDGPGVAAERRGRIFEPFQSEREDGQGTGLGLAIVRTVAEEHGAEISVEQSAALGGARFVLRFRERT